MNEKPLLIVNQLRVQIDTLNGTIYAVDGVDLILKRGEIFALVGESGCGKSITALSINRLLPDNAYLCEDSEIFLDGEPLHQLSENSMRKIRCNKIGMIFQDPSSALNPVLNIADQLQEALLWSGHTINTKELQKEMLDLLQKVRIPDPAWCLQQYPHQLSGGMKQRIVIAIALAKKPDLLIADEPTTALDVTTQAQVLSLIKDLNTQLNMAILLITHDLGIVAQMADKVAVMYAGHIIEQSTTKEFLVAPKHPYSQQLFAALPERTSSLQTLAVIPGQVPSLNQIFTLCRFKDRCRFIFKPCEEIKPRLTQVNESHSVRCHWYDKEILALLPKELNIQSLSSIAVSVKESKDIVQPEDDNLLLKVNSLKVYFPIVKGFLRRTVGFIKAVDGLTLSISEGQTVALVGESGCGKTTVGKAILRLIDVSNGEIIFQNQDLLKLSPTKLRRKRSEFQMIFQDPYSSMDPRMRVSDIIEEGMIALNIGTNQQERQDRIDTLLSQVGLAKEIKARFAHELSGGQRQRVAIARALAVGAQLIVCDEPTSALDVSVQAQILNVLKSLQRDLSISYLFITHNIGVVNYLADIVAIMYLGRIVEYGPAQAVLSSPKHPYTQALMDSVPSLTRELNFRPLKGEIPSPANPPRGCHFSPRCPKVHSRCLEKYPNSYLLDPDHGVSCYLYSPEEIEIPNERNQYQKSAS